ncbi:hypothetical protein BGZ60DRAFT_554066 [Tricladium varicosporioides]|nr:hypothetical protein BGZ60DRAFT_554066 [Hymenoscyphus varicosporioides]
MPFDDKSTVSLLQRECGSGFPPYISTHGTTHGIGADLGLPNPILQRRMKEASVDP